MMNDLYEANVKKYSDNDIKLLKNNLKIYENRINKLLKYARHLDGNCPIPKKDPITYEKYLKCVCGFDDILIENKRKAIWNYI